MLSPEEHDALEREWNDINHELERLAADRPQQPGPSDPLAPAPEPTQREQQLLGRLDEIEYILGEDDLARRRSKQSRSRSS